MQDLNEGVKLLQESKRIMLTGSSRLSYDELAALISLYLLFHEQGKTPTVVFAQKPTGLRAQLLEKYEVPVETELLPPSYTISIPYENGEIGGLRYEQEGGSLNLYITPGQAEFDFAKVKYAVEGGNYDAILILGCKRIDWLGEIHRNNRELFESTQKLNLSNQKAAQNFGDFNLVDSQKQTLSEIVYELVSLLGGTQNEKIINCLMEGAVAGADFTQKGEFSESSMNIITNLSKAGASLKDAINEVYFSLDESKTLSEKIEKELKGEVQVEVAQPTEVPQPEKNPIKRAANEVKEVVKDLVKPEESAGKSETTQQQQLLVESPKEESGIPSKGFVEPPEVAEAAVVPFGAPVKKDK